MEGWFILGSMLLFITVFAHKAIKIINEFVSKS
jgi:hypothetical protein